MEFIINNPSQQQFFQNQRYSFSDYDTKKITLFYSGSGVTTSSETGDTIPTNVIITNASGSASYVTGTYDSQGNFNFSLVEPITIDKMADVFLDSFSMLNCSGVSDKGSTFGAVLKFNDINQNNFSNNTAINNGELIVLDDSIASNGSGTFIIAKNKKFNYMGVMQPGRYKNVIGKLTTVNNEPWTNNAGSLNFVFSIELVISNKK